MKVKEPVLPPLFRGPMKGGPARKVYEFNVAGFLLHEIAIVFIGAQLMVKAETKKGGKTVRFHDLRLLPFTPKKILNADVNKDGKLSVWLEAEKPPVKKRPQVKYDADFYMLIMILALCFIFHIRYYVYNTM